MARPEKDPAEKFVSRHLKLHPELNDRLIRMIPDKKRSKAITTGLELFLNMLEAKKVKKEILEEFQA